MDVLSSQANLAGYRAVVDGAGLYGRALPMMMTAAAPSRREDLHHGRRRRRPAGDRHGAPPRRGRDRDRRPPATKEQVESLGAKFLAVEDDDSARPDRGRLCQGNVEGISGEAAELTASHIAKQDIVITTALIPGRPAPKLVSADMVASMKPGSVLVDLAVERGGNVEGAKLGEVVTTANGVKIAGYANMRAAWRRRPPRSTPRTSTPSSRR